MATAPAAVAAAPATGGASLLLPLLLTFGPSIFSKLFAGQDPQEKLRRQIQALLNPATLAKLKEEYYRQNLSSPAYSQAQQTIAAGANQTANETAANLAARGIGTTGTGAVLSALTPSLVGHSLAGIRTAAYDSAGTQAQQNVAQQIAALTGTQGPSRTTQLFAGGLEAFQPYLQAYLRSKYPNLAAGWVPQAAR